LDDDYECTALPSGVRVTCLGKDQAPGGSGDDADFSLESSVAPPASWMPR